MKILILDTYYWPVLQTFYRRCGKAGLNYVEHRQKLLAMGFGTADFYSKNLQQLGHEAGELIINDQILQKKWAKENGVFALKYFLDSIPYIKLHFKSGWLTEILWQQVADYQPDILYCQDVFTPGSEFLSKVKREFNTFVVGQVGGPTRFVKEYFAAYDLLISCLPSHVTNFRRLGKNAEYLRTGFESTLIPSLIKIKKQYDVTFVGGFTKHHLEGTNLLETFEYLANNVTVNFWGYGSQHLPVNSPILKTFHKEQVWGKNMLNILNNSKITINRHIGIAKNHAGNMRLYEATGVGSMLITDYKSDLGKLFVPGKEVETYKTKEELVEKVKYYLAHEMERLKIAKAGQKRTLKDHTYKVRMRELAAILKRYI